MTPETLNTTIESLDDLLDNERRALLAGNLDEITRLHARKENLINVLNQLGADETASLSSLNAKLKRNQTLLNTALGGIRSVARRLATIRRVRQSLDTYDSMGRKKSVEMDIGRSTERRA